MLAATLWRRAAQASERRWRRLCPLPIGAFISAGRSTGRRECALEATEPDPRELFPVVGLGASAGGLRALQAFFSRIPEDSGMAFVVVSHHHADQPSLLVELLRNRATIPVEEASEGAQLAPDHAYVAPPGHNLALENGRLHLRRPLPERLPPLPIDAFLRSLAEDARERGVAVILSGTGSDGTLGVQAIKAHSGLVLVQAPETAEFTGMPDSAIATGLADYIDAPEQMAAPLLAWARSGYPAAVAREDIALVGEEDLQRIVARIHAATGHDFSGYKPNTLQRRIHRRQSLHELPTIRDYLRLLDERDDEVQALLQELLIGVTGFFRDPEAFEALDPPLRSLLAEKSPRATVRAWVPGCCTGEEAYSLAILLHEQMEALQKPLEIQVFGTDLDPRSVEIARRGVYPEGIASDLSERRLARYFEPRDGAYQISKEIRQQLVFAVQNLLGDPPFTRMDLISCRNLLIYLKPEFQRQVLRVLHYSLNPGGLLMLGTSESTGNLEDLFEPENRRWKLYRKRNVASNVLGSGAARAALPAARPQSLRIPSWPSSDDVARILADTWAPPSVLVNESGELVHVHGHTGSFLEPAQGQASINVLQMARAGLRPALTWLLRESARNPAEPVSRQLRVRTNGEFQPVRLSARRVAASEAGPHLTLLSFEILENASTPEASSPDGLHPIPEDSNEQALRLELTQTHEDLQATIEALQSTNEELASSNEEVQSTNEELQSANEELETSREEMQSLNEELQTVNAELRGKIEELSQASDDMANLLNSTDIAMLFLDRALRVVRFTPDISKLIPLQESDLGRPLADLALRVDRDLAEDAGEVLRTLAPRDADVRSAGGATTYLMRARAYRTADNIIDGVVMTFVDVTRLKQMEARELAGVHAEAIVRTVHEPLLTLDAELRIRSANRAFCELFEIAEAQVCGTSIFDLPGSRWDVPRLRALLLDVIPRDSAVSDYALEVSFPSGGAPATLHINARKMSVEGDRPSLILLALSRDP